MEKIYYSKRKHEKYTVREDCSIVTGIKTSGGSIGPLSITVDGRLDIKQGYTWDGPSGPAIDTKNFMRPSLVHDALYQLIREGLIIHSNRVEADKLLRRMCLEDGMSRIRAWWVYKTVRKCGADSVKSDTLIAP